MEENIGVREQEFFSLLEQIKKCFKCKEQDVRTYSPLTLAYIGDGVYELVIRTVIVERANRSNNDLHKKTIKYVNAGTQAKIAEALSERFTEEEEAVYKRGRNAKSATTAKNASLGDYKKATGLEALLGYLYLTDRMPRVLELIKEGIRLAGMEI
ncbi:MAG: ribonuclease III [Bacteroidales bacterium]|nr:ribonuclease III [Lachnoclostridium sp.]MCM1385477.1 ribonuclease III [Lachnoclostridium sp.]MCM1466237.1 ribonuclease III [Bacteroidales bacterium]